MCDVCVACMSFVGFLSAMEIIRLYLRTGGAAGIMHVTTRCARHAPHTLFVFFCSISQALTRYILITKHRPLVNNSARSDKDALIKCHDHESDDESDVDDDA
jgi:hypothetical protein